MKIAYATDIHGHLPTLDNLFALGKRDDIDAVVVGGDITPGFDKARQAHFLEKEFIPRVAQVKKPVLVILGNDDYATNVPVLEKADSRGVLHFIHLSSTHVGDWAFSGYSFVNRGPLFVPDWMKDEDDISEDLKQLPTQGQRILVAHAPPYNTALDVVWNKQHVGSRALRTFIEHRQPWLTLHGHIHESPELTGQVQETIGKTVCINPGNAKCIIIDVDKREIV